MLNEFQKSVLIGHMLGDGHLEMHKHCKNACLKISRKDTDKDYILWSKDVFKEFISDNPIRDYKIFDNRTKKTYYGVKFSTKADPIFTEFHKNWYLNRKKKIPNDLILNKDIVKVWFADDGCVMRPLDKLNRTRFSIKFATHSFSYTEVHFLRSQLNNIFDVKFKIYKELSKKTKKYQYTIRLSKKEECRKFLKEIDESFPLKRKSDIWRNTKYRLFEDIPCLPACVFCNSFNTRKNGKVREYQKYLCLNCGRQCTPDLKRKYKLRKTNYNFKGDYTGKYWRK